MARATLCAVLVLLSGIEAWRVAHMGLNDTINIDLPEDDRTAYMKSIALERFVLMERLPNIHPENCNYDLVVDGCVQRLKVDAGYYTFAQVAAKFFTRPDILTLTQDPNSLVPVLNISSSNTTLNFAVENSVGPYLGFEEREYGPGLHEGTPPTLERPRVIVVSSDSVKSTTLLQEELQPVIASFIVFGPELVNIEVPRPEFVPLRDHHTGRVAIIITDVKRKPIKFAGGGFFISLLIL